MSLYMFRNIRSTVARCANMLCRHGRCAELCKVRTSACVYKAEQVSWKTPHALAAPSKPCKTQQSSYCQSVIAVRRLARSHVVCACAVLLSQEPLARSGFREPHHRARIVVHGTQLYVAF